MTVKVAPIPRAALGAEIEAVALLRIAVFREWPYLYEGDLAYEAGYLAPYLECPGAVVIGAWDGAQLVGAATGAPMEDHAAEFGAPFRAAGYNIEEIFYCAESVLLPAYRGQGIGNAFFDHREAQARALDRKRVTFCAVLRPEGHPARPADYTPLDGFWRKRGYRPIADLKASFAWKDVGDATETEKPMQFWMRDL